jgi:hypothetical protein
MSVIAYAFLRLNISGLPAHEVHTTASRFFEV